MAAALAVVPGLGHFYLGENKKGIAYLVGVGGLEFFGLDLDLSIIGALIGVPLEIGGGSLWLFSIVDAYRTARRLESEAVRDARRASESDAIALATGWSYDLDPLDLL